MTKDKDKGRDVIGRQIEEELESIHSGAEQVSAALQVQAHSYRNEFEKVSIDQSYVGPASFSALYDEDEDGGVPLWLISFTDIMALMLTFFVLLYSMAVPDAKQWEEMIHAVEEGITVQKTLKAQAGKQQEISIDKIETQRALDLNYLQNILQRQFEQTESLSSALLLKGEGQLIISLPMDVVFDSGSAKVEIEAKRALMALGDLFHRIRNRIEVVGHADPSPVLNGGYDNNWSLSLARSANIAALLRQAGYKRDVVVRGVSSARFADLSDSIPPEMREQMARRVDIVIMQDTGRPRFFAPVNMK